MKTGYTSWRASESASLVLPLAGAGSAHDYVFEVGRHRLWRGRVKVLRFDPIGREGVAVAIESIRLLPLE